MYTIQTTNRFEKEVAKCKKRGLDLNKLREVITLLAKEGKLPARYKPHKLSGKYAFTSLNDEECKSQSAKKNFISG